MSLNGVSDILTGQALSSQMFDLMLADAIRRHRDRVAAEYVRALRRRIRARASTNDMPLTAVELEGRPDAVFTHGLDYVERWERRAATVKPLNYFAHVAAGVSGGLIGWGLQFPPPFAMPGGVVSGVIGAGLTHALWAQWPESLWAAPNDIERAARVGQLVSLGILPALAILVRPWRR
jgi:hypothetical protein